MSAGYATGNSACRSRRLWSLWDIMITFSFPRMLSPLQEIAEAQARVQDLASRTTNAPLEGERKRVVSETLMLLGMMNQGLGYRSFLDRLRRLEARIADRWPLKPEDLANELRVLGEALHDDMNKRSLYLYPESLSETLAAIHKDWEATLKSFPSAKPEIESAVDCYCLQHPTAAIFHFMRIAEQGLRALARERKVKLTTRSGKEKMLEWGTWQDILSALTQEHHLIGSKWPPGPKKDAALDFYSGAIGGLNAFKDKYRNTVFHVRKTYEMEDAQKVMRQVRDFMNEISMKVGERTRRSIRRWT